MLINTITKLQISFFGMSIKIASTHSCGTHSSFHTFLNKSVSSSGITRSMVIPGPETKVMGESGSRGHADKGLILHVLRIS